MQSNRIAGRWREIRSRQAINRDKSWISAMHWSNYSQHILMQIRSKVNRAAASRNFSTEIFLPDEQSRETPTIEDICNGENIQT